jgi:hypothetical protein
MRVDAISIPAGAQEVSTAAGPVLPAPLSFSATLASSIRSSAPEHPQDQSAPAGKIAKPDFKLGTKFGASLNAKLAGKSNGKSEAKVAVNSAVSPEIQPSLPIYPLSDSLLDILLTTSLTALPTASLTLAKTADAPPLLSAQAVVPTVQITPGTFSLSGTPNALSLQDQSGSTVTSAVPLPVTARTETLPTSNFSDALDALPANSGGGNAPVNVSGSSEPNPKCAELLFASGQAAPDAAYSFHSVPTGATTRQAQFSTSAASVLPTPTVFASLTAPLLTSASPTPAPSATTTDVSTAPPSADSQFHVPIPTGATILVINQSSIVQSPILQSPSVPAALFSPAPLTPAELLMQPAPSSLPKNSVVQPKDQPVPSPAYSSSPVVPTNSAPNTLSPTSSVTTPAPAPTLQSPAPDINPAPVTEPAGAKQPAAGKSSDSKAGNSKLVNSSPGNFEPGGPTAGELAPTFSSATLYTAPAQALSSGTTTTVAAQDVAGNNISSPDANLTPNSAAPAPASASITATTSDAPGNGKPAVSIQPTPAVVPQTNSAYEKSEKKSSAAVPPNATALRTTPLHDVPATLASGKESSATLTAPAPPAFAPPAEVRSGAPPELPKTHQMLDSSPPAPSTPAIAPDPAAAARINAQMHVGIRTEAFGAVEIHTVVQQSQVGITVHADRDIARWFTSELPGLESGLNKNHLNLTAVDFDNGRSGVQTATSFQHGQPQQHFSETPGSQSAALPDQNTASESAADILTSDLYIGSAQTHVSIHV